MSRSKIATRLISKTTGLACGVLLSLSAYSQTDSTKPAPTTFIFSKYQLPVQGDSATANSFFAAPLKASPYKINYKIKTLTFPSDPNPKPERFNLVDALITGYLESRNKDENANNTIVPFKKHP